MLGCDAFEYVSIFRSLLARPLFVVFGFRSRQTSDSGLDDVLVGVQD